MRTARLVGVLASGWTLCAWPAVARADVQGLWPLGTPGRDPTFNWDLDFFGQVEAGGFVALNDFSGFGGLGLKSQFSVEGIGGAVGLRWERDARGSGGLGFFEPQLRPFELAKWRLYRYVDPYLAVGTELGANARGFRATAYAAGGVDIALWPSEAHPALNVEYVLRAAQTPDDFATQVLSLGLSVRSVF
ncbi:MAG TPA: hypothetical protein VGM44_17845 [Polyangiaceae bacterium]|jgi:hypothetical protein